MGTMLRRKGFIVGDCNHLITRRHDKMEALSVDIERKVGLSGISRDREIIAHLEESEAFCG